MKLLIVDDEHFTCDGLCRMAEDFHLGFDKILTAMSGERALELIGAESPEVILSDIRMPGMNGLEMAKAAKAGNPECQIVFMSGYNDREYIKTALDIQALGFIDKPIDEEELLAVLGKAVLASRETLRTREVLDFRRQEELARKILGGTPPESGLDRVPAPDPGWVFRCALLFPSGDGLEEIAVLLRRDTEWGVCTTDSAGRTVIFLRHRAGEPGNALYSTLLGQDEGLRLAVGNAVRNAEKLPMSYRSAAFALDTLFYLSGNRIVQSAGLAASALDMTAVAAEYRAALAAGREQAMAYLEELRDRLLDNPYTPPGLAKSHYYEMLCLTAAGDRRVEWDACQRAGTLQELEMLLWEALSNLEEQPEEPATPHLVRMTKKLIQENFGDSQLGIADIARQIHSSAGHLSAVFKKHTGDTLLQYITLCRVEYAKKQLVSSNRKIHEIARGAGYNDPYYFSRIFQREAGMTPQQYRMTMYRES